MAYVYICKYCIYIYIYIYVYIYEDMKISSVI